MSVTALKEEVFTLKSALSQHQAELTAVQLKYDRHAHHITRVYCHAHARRKFEGVLEASGKSKEAKHVIALYKRLYAIERHAKDNALSLEARYPIMLD